MKTFKKSKIDSVVEFLKNNWRYFAAILVFACVVVVLANCTGPDRRNAFADSTEEVSVEDFVLDAEFEVNGNEELCNLIADYFDAYASGDTLSLEDIATPITDNEKSYINVCSQYFENYQNVTCYTKHGLLQGAYFVSVYYELKFYGIDTPAPGLAFFYVETDGDGKMYINNSFCAYNRERMETEMDSDVYNIYITYGQQADIASIREDVQRKYQDALNSDPALVSMLSSTFPTAIDEWRRNLVYASTEGEGETGEDVVTPEENPEVEGGEVAGESPEGGNDMAVTAGVSAELKKEYGGIASSRVVYVKIAGESVNVRDKADKSGKLLGKAKKGETYTRTGINGDWTIIDFKGKTGYIKTEFLE